MTNRLIYDGIKIQCGKCLINDDCVSIYIWWRNQYGAKVRIFCHACNVYTDAARIQERYTAEIHPIDFGGIPKKGCNR